VSQIELVKSRRDGDRYHLDGRPVHCGDVVELLFDGADDWRRVRLEGMPDQVLACMELAGGLVLSASVPVGATLRWPAARLQPAHWRHDEALRNTTPVTMVRLPGDAKPICTCNHSLSAHCLEDWPTEHNGITHCRHIDCLCSCFAPRGPRRVPAADLAVPPSRRPVVPLVAATEKCGKCGCTGPAPLGVHFCQSKLDAIDEARR
jgi:hypothetical protein